jgi:hypothetical protein
MRRAAGLFGISESDSRASRNTAVPRQELARLRSIEGRDVPIGFRFAVAFG